MIRKSIRIIFAMLLVFGLGALPVKAAEIVKTATADGLRIELHVLPAEPFHTADQVKANPGLEGMLVVGGAEPLALDAQPQPNHHLIVHVFDAETGKALTDAEVSIIFQPEKNGMLEGEATQIPVAVMQVIGKGPETTHYGNNVVLPAGTYAVTVVANGREADFHIDVKSANKN